MTKIFKYSAVILALSLIITLVYTSSATPLDKPMLYFNDSTWAREDRSPLKIIDGVEYVPLTIFAQMKNTKVRVNETLNTFVITHSALYISIDATTSIATNHNNRLYTIPTHKLDYGERYVPARDICRHVGLGFDSFINPLTNEIAVRITDGTETLSFEELLNKYNPDILKTEVQTEQSDQATGPDDSQDTEETQKLTGKRTVYITFPETINANTETSLDILNAYGYTATFFVDSSDIINNPLVISEMISEGHKVGIKPRSPGAYTNIESLISEINSINDLLYRVFKFKTRTVMLDAMYTYNNDLLAAVNGGALTEEGYSLWRTTAERTDGIYNNHIASQKMIDILLKNTTIVYNLGNNYYTPNILDSTLSYIYRNRHNCDVRLADAAYIPPNR